MKLRTQSDEARAARRLQLAYPLVLAATLAVLAIGLTLVEHAHEGVHRGAYASLEGSAYLAAAGH